MRRQDLRTLDRNLIISIIVLFSFLSFIFLIISWLGIIDPVAINNKIYLWTSYGILLLVIGIVFLISKKPIIKWTKPTTAISKSSMFKLEKGKSYLIKEPKNAKSIEMLKDSLAAGIPGLCLTRNNPKTIQLEGAQVIWLTELDTPNRVDPTDLEEITYTINKYLDKVESNAVILLDGLEYLISFLGFDKVLHLIQDLRDTMSLKGSTLLVPVAAPTLALTSSKLLEKELEVYA